MLCQRYKVGTLQIDLRLSTVALTSCQLLFWYSVENYLFGDNRHLKCVNTVKAQLCISISYMETMQTDLNTSLTMLSLCWRNIGTI